MFIPSVKTVWWQGFPSIYEVRFSCLTAWEGIAAVAFACTGLFFACLCSLRRSPSVRLVSPICCCCCFFLHLLHWIIYVRFVVSQVMWCLICLVSLFVGESVWCFSIVNLCIGGWHYLTKTHKKSCEFTQGNFTRFSCLTHQIFMAKTKGIFMGSTYENTIKKAMKIL